VKGDTVSKLPEKRTPAERLEDVECRLARVCESLERIYAAVDRLLPPPGKPQPPATTKPHHLRVVADERRAA
jgi:hypothetical protein